MGDLGWTPDSENSAAGSERGWRWYRELNRYHWFVLVVAALGWLFDTMDQQLFNFARIPALKELLAPAPGEVAPQALVDQYAGLATAIFLIGWASGGLIFGVLGDRIGRAKTMLLTILVYSLCTGLSAVSVSFWDFAFYRFITGLGVGGEFAVGVALVAEVMPSRARQHALSLLQALSAVGNLTAAAISVWLGHLETTGVLGEAEFMGFRLSAWRLMFVIGTVPALLAILIRGRLREPDQWTRTVSSEADSKGPKRVAGSYAELFGDPRWRHGAIVGLILATSGVIGVWGIAFFSFDLVRSVFRKTAEQEMRDSGFVEMDQLLIAHAIANPAVLDEENEQGRKLGAIVPPNAMISTAAGQRDTDLVWSAVLASYAKRKEAQQTAEQLQAPLTSGELLAHANSTELEKHRAAFEKLVSTAVAEDSTALAARLAKQEQAFAEAFSPEGKTLESMSSDSVTRRLATWMSVRTAQISGELTKWSGYAGMLLNVGAFFGMYGFGAVSSRIGRRPAFLIAFTIAGASAILVFAMMQTRTDVLWMFPLMGFCVLSPFAGYAIYFPELFPTRLRSTGTSFCYNVGRYFAATGPLTLGLLTGTVFADTAEPLRWAGVSMSAVYLLGIIVLPFAKETKDQPLPE